MPKVLEGLAYTFLGSSRHNYLYPKAFLQPLLPTQVSYSGGQGLQNPGLKRRVISIPSWDLLINSLTLSAAIAVALEPTASKLFQSLMDIPK